MTYCIIKNYRLKLLLIYLFYLKHQNHYTLALTPIYKRLGMIKLGHILVPKLAFHCIQ